MNDLIQINLIQQLIKEQKQNQQLSQSLISSSLHKTINKKHGYKMSRVMSKQPIPINNPQNLHQKSNRMQMLLQQFNKIDHRKQGSIKLTQAIKLVKIHTNKDLINKFDQTILQSIIFNHQNQVTFDQFLAMLYQTELQDHRKNQHDLQLINENMVDFLRLLQDYRKKCQDSSEYLQAQKAHQKILQIKNKQLKRHKQKLLSQQKTKVTSVNTLQQTKIIQFNSAWNQYMQKYEQAALNSIQKLKARHLREMQQEQQRIRNYYQNYLKPSKKVIDLRVKQKMLVKQREYQQAQRVKQYSSKIFQKQRQIKRQQIDQRIQKRKQTLQKHQQISLLAHLKRIQKDRNQQMKQRELDSSKMLIKLKNLQNDLVQKQSIQIKSTLDNLRETMCLTSSQLFQGGASRRMKSLDKLQKINHQDKIQKIDDILPKQSKDKTSFKIRVNSFHRVKMDRSLYDP